MDRHLVHGLAQFLDIIRNMRTILLLMTAAAWAGFLSAGPVQAEADLSLLPDPTRPVGVGEMEGVRSRGLTAIRITSRDRRAVIDGRTVGVGDSVNGAVVRDIRPEEVILQNGDRVSTMRLSPEIKRNAQPRDAGK